MVRRVAGRAAAQWQVVDGGRRAAGRRRVISDVRSPDFLLRAWQASGWQRHNEFCLCI